MVSSAYAVTACWVASTLLIGMCASAETVDAPGAPEARALTTAEGCKFLSPAPVGRVPPKIEWTGGCVDGWLDGEGRATVTGGGQLIYIGVFRRGEIQSGSIETGNRVYRGELKNNQPNGTGVLTFDQSTEMRGRWKAGNPEGEMDVRMGASHYLGEIGPHSLQLEGKGKMEYGNGATYEGMFHNSFPEGQGIERLPDGMVREGTFVQGFLTGTGSIRWANGDHYEGEVRGDLANGKGVYYWASGNRYEGESRGGAHTGFGTKYWTNGDKYEGEFVNDDQQGKGKFTFANGEFYEGDWIAGKLNGHCHLSRADGGMYEGECVEHEYSGHGHLESADTHEIYDGEFRKGLYEGKGKLRAGKYTYEGLFKAGLKDGLGKEVYEGAFTYEGEFAHGVWNGHGVLINYADDGSEMKYDGEFRNGQIEGNGALVSGKLKMNGKFANGHLTKGTIQNDGRRFDIDTDAGSIEETMPDGSKHSLDALPDDVRI